MGVTLKTVMPGVTVRTNSSTGSRTVRFACMINGVRHTKMCDLPIEILIDLHGGNESATAWGCDLTHEYVSINADYRT